MGIMMFLKQLEVGSNQNFTYILACKRTGEGAIVDPGWEVNKILNIAKNGGIKIKNIILTHTHSDHIEGVFQVVETTGAKIYVHQNESHTINRSGSYFVTEVQNEEMIKMGKESLKVIHTPGHTPGGICLYTPGKVLTGDTLFVGYCGRADFTESNPEALFNSLQKLAILPDDTVVYPGHNYGKTPTSTIGNEKANNPYYQCGSLEEFVELRMHGHVE